MNKLKRLVYDVEIIRCIPSRRDTLELKYSDPGLEYCMDWRDWQGMGVSTIGAIDLDTHRPFIFMPDNLLEFKELVSSYDLLCGFNNLSFDNPLLAANDIIVPVEKSYDLLIEIWAAAGLPRRFSGAKSGGYNLDAVVKANTGFGGKTGSGAGIPIDWQKRRYGKVANYCLDDVFFMCEVINIVNAAGGLRDPKTGKFLGMPIPEKATTKGV